MEIWTPIQGQTLLVRREPTNSKDNNAVGVFLEDIIVGHVPHNLAPRFSQFLRRDVNNKGDWREGQPGRRIWT